MRKHLALYRMMCAALAFCLGLTALCLPVFAEGEPRQVILKYDSSMGSVAVNSAQTDAAALEEIGVWTPSKNIAQGEEVEALGGDIVISPVEAMTYNSGNKATVDGTDYTGSIAGSNNPKFTDGVATGSILKIDVKKTGLLSYVSKLGNGKIARAVNVEDVNNYLVNETNNSGASMDVMVSFAVTAGESYYIYGNGTRMAIFAIMFEEMQTAEAVPGDTVTLNIKPNGDSLIGNVELDDDTIAIENSDDWTMVEFEMPDKDVIVNIDFVSKSIEDEIANISFDEIRGENTDMNSITSNLELWDGRNTSIGYADVRWTSSDENIISGSGVINPTSEDRVVTLTAIFSYQDYSNIFLQKSFTLTVPRDSSTDEEAVEIAKDNLTLGNTSSVRNDLTLPLEGVRGTAITWTSSNENVISADGKVTIPEGDTDAVVVLTATISRGSASTTKEFTVTVPARKYLDIINYSYKSEDGTPSFTKIDNGTLDTIRLTEDIPEKTGDELLVLASYETDGDGVRSILDAKLISVADISAGSDGVLAIHDAGLRINSGSEVKIFLIDGADSIAPMLSEPYTLTETVKDNPTIYVAGDSTASVYAHTGNSKNNRFPQTGWAQVFGQFFSGATVNDKALSGRSSLSFRSESNYRDIVNNISEGDYLIIQFGHNDSKSDDASRYTDPNGDIGDPSSYKNSLMQYINVAFDNGAYPILATSISRRQLSDSGLEQYVKAARELGEELGIPVLDMYAKTNGWINKVVVVPNDSGDGYTTDPERANDIFNHVKPKDSRFVNVPFGDFANSQYYTSAPTDNTHLNYFGALMVSQWACEELERLNHPLTEKFSGFSYSEDDLPSYADATSVE